MKKIIFIIPLVFLLSCSVKKVGEYKTEKINFSLLKVDDFKDVYQFKGLNVQTHDTIYILSYKQKIYNELLNPKITNNVVQIKSDANYVFDLVRIKIRVSTMQQLGQYIIVEKDTFWRGSSHVIPPKYYIAQNAIDVFFE